MNAKIVFVYTRSLTIAVSVLLCWPVVLAYSLAGSRNHLDNALWQTMCLLLGILSQAMWMVVLYRFMAVL